VLPLTCSVRVMTAACGALGTITLIGSFGINPAPPADASVAQLAEFAIQHHTTIVLGGWLQGIGSLLTVLFALALVHLSGAAHRFAGWATLLSGSALLMVSLVEVTFYLAAAQAALSGGDTSTGIVANNLIKAVQHVFLVAPALLLPLGYILFTDRLLPRPFGVTALGLGALLQVLGLVNLFDGLQPVIGVVLIVQGVWFLAAAVAVTFVRRVEPVAHSAAGSA